MLLKVGMAMMAFALALVAITAGVTVALRDEPESAIAAKPASESAPEPLVRSYPPEVVQAQPEPRSKPAPRDEPRAEPKPKPQPEPEPEQVALPVTEDDWPTPTDEELQAANEPRHYDLPPGAIMGLTIKAIDLHNVPVFNSDSESALSQGVIHEPETSLPWSNTPQRNVYIAGHRLGYYGTLSRLVFYNLDKLHKGDLIVLKDRDGKAYRYRVSETFVTNPRDVWVMGQVRGRDMVTLQTCTPYPTFDKRLIVRADRV
ncbi:MAG: sortase [Chloroflexota bacterium]|jgi:sortase A|nr:sortase [Chloroflexota bacterium]